MKKENVNAFIELYELISFFYENRDLPVEPDFNFYERVENLCAQLNLDYDLFIEEFKLKKFP